MYYEETRKPAEMKAVRRYGKLVDLAVLLALDLHVDRLALHEDQPPAQLRDPLGCRARQPAVDREVLRVGGG